MAVDRSRELGLELEGASEDGGALRLDELQQFLQQWLATLAAEEREISGEGVRTTAYQIVTLSYASPVNVRVRAVPEKGRQDLGPEVVARFARHIEQINRGEEPEGIAVPTLQAFQKLTAGYRKHLTAIRFKADDHTIYVPRDFDAKVAKLLKNVYSSFGTFRGRLQALNLHSNPRVVFMYPVAGPFRIRCTYRKGQFPDLGALLDTEPMVDVYGRMKYRGDAPHPFEIELEQIDPLPAEADLPKVNDLLGSMPGIRLILDE